MKRTENLSLPIYDNPESDIFKINDVNNAHETIDKQYKELKNIKETVESTNPSANLQGQINDISASLETKANKTITDNIQGQVNNLVLGAVGDGNNAEVVQARGTKALLNDRLLDIEGDIDISLKDYELINLVYDKTGVITTNKFINNAGNIVSASNSIIRYITISNIKTGVPLYVGSIGQHPFKVTTAHIGQIQIIDDSETVLAIVNATENMPSSGISATLNSIPEGATKLRFNLGYNGNDFEGKLYVGYRPFLEKYLYKSNSYISKIQEEVDGLKIIKEEVENSRKEYQTLGERLDRNDKERNIIFKDYELYNLIFDLNRVTTYDKFINGSGVVVNTVGRRYIEVPIIEGKTLYVSGTGVNPYKITTNHIGQMQILDENKTVLSVLNETTDGTAGNTTSGVIPEGGKWLRVNTNYNGNEFVGNLYIGYNPVQDKYFLEENAYENREINLIKTQANLNPLYGKKIVAIGDSMVKGHTLSENDVWLTKLALRNGMTYKNYGINGSYLIAKPGLVNGEKGIIERYTDMDDDADYVVVFGGTNDASGVPLGEFGSTDNTTFYGALNNLCKGLIAKYPTKKIMFITPFKRKASFLQYVNAIEEVCSNYGIAVFNNYKRGGVSFEIQEQVSALTLGDNVHLNAAGHEYSSYKYEAELKRL